MATSVYFSGAVRSEQDLYEDLVTESIKVFGQDVVYIPRESLGEDALLNEEWSQFTQAYPVEMYLENVEGFEGDGNLLGKFGLEIRDQANLVVTKRRWDQAVGQNIVDGQASPNEGDLIYMTMTQRLFEIKYVEPKSPFYQLQDLPSYTLTAELFEYNDQHFDTGYDEIDAIEWDNATAYSYIVTANTANFELGELVTQWTGSNDSSGNPINIEGYVAGWEGSDDRITIISPHQSTNGDGTFMTHHLSSSPIFSRLTSISFGSGREFCSVSETFNSSRRRPWGKTLLS